MSNAIGVHPIAFDPLRWSMAPPCIAEGLVGYTYECLGVLWIVMIIAEPPGEGHCGRYLDSCTQAKVIVVEPNRQLSSMLERRGFKIAQVETPVGEIVCAYTRSHNG